MAKVGIAERIAELRQETAVANEKSRRDIAHWLFDVLDGRRSASGAQMKAAEIINRMHGWNEPDKLTVTKSPEQQEAELAEKLQSPAYVCCLLQVVIPAALRIDECRELLSDLLDADDAAIGAAA